MLRRAPPPAAHGSFCSPEAIGSIAAPCVSPDGRTIAFFGVPEAKDRRPALYVRPLDSLTARPILEVDDGSSLFWSADSRSLAFVAGSKLKRLEVDRPASVETIATVDLKYRYGAGGTWSRAGDILIGGAPGIIRVNVKTGAIAPVAKVKPGVTAHLWPVFLPDGEHFIFCTRSPVSGVQVFLGDLAHSGQASYLLDAESSYIAYAPDLEAAGRGFLVFERESSLMAQAVDTESGTLQGRPFLLDPAQGIWGEISASTSGAVVAKSQLAASPQQLKWLDRQGRQTGAAGEPAPWGEVQLTRDAGHAILSLFERSRRIRVLDLARGVTSPLNSPASGIEVDYAIAVAPDGRVAFTGVNASKLADIYVKPLNGAGVAPELVYSSPNTKHPNDWSYDGRFLIYDDHDTANRQDLWILPFEGDRKPYPFLATSADETLAQFSPDGKWLAYQSDESGRGEIYVQAFSPGRPADAAGGKWQISNGGGGQVRWRRDGKEMFYYNARDSKMMAVPVWPGATFNPGAPAPLFEAALFTTGGFSYDVTADGSRFLVNRTAKEVVLSRLMVMTNALPALARQAAAVE